MITDEQKENIIVASYNMIQALVEAYGTEQGMEFWNQMGDTLDPYFKGEIFRRMLCGEFSARIKIKGLGAYATNRIALIKAIRVHDKRRLPLKEAKEIVDNIFNGYPEYLEPHSGCRADAIDDLRDAGFII